MFAMYLLFICSLLLFQACKKERPVESQELAVETFLKAVRQSNSILKAMPIVQRTNGKFRTTETKVVDPNPIYVVPGPGTTPPPMPTLNEVTTLEQLVVLSNNYNLDLLRAAPDDSYIAVYNLPLASVEAALAPATQAAVAYFYSKGFTQAEITEMLDGEDPSTLVPIVMAATAPDELLISQNLTNLFIQGAYAKSFRDCFIEATGIAAGIAVIGALTAQTMDKTLVKSLVNQAVKKIGGRALGAIGLAIIVIDISICLN